MGFWDAALPTLAGAAGGFMMGGPVGAAAGGAAGFAGYEANRRNTEAANRNAQAEAQKQRDWQSNMSNTAHQREVKDLQAAGLNPTLSADGGNGSSTPGGSMGQTFEAQTPTISFPEVLQARSLLQKDRELDMMQTKQTQDIMESKSRKGNLDADTILKGKGKIRAEAESEAAAGLQNLVRQFKKSYAEINPPMDPKSLEKQNRRTIDEYNRKNGTAFKYNQIFQQGPR